MELRALAEQILFAKTLEEKLQCPALITDEHPGTAIAAPSSPGRPPELRFKSHDAAKAGFPGVHRLAQASERGKLLHFFANHELLASELMALVLLRFPDAPAAFRRGVLQTLKDEQEHTRLYLEQMRVAGIHFGELPVSGYFWRAVSRMEHPIDYVAGLSLTFEQANLDFARHFSRSFAQVGDSATARLLEKIHRDEIAHVAYGLKWFRRWKNPQQSDWEAFCRHLKFPLSPQRAKGFAVNVEARRAAGLDAQFIAELDVYTQSKGRTPSVFVFNPFEEGRMARGRSFTPTKHQVQLARDLANLPQFLCRQDDIVLVPQRPSTEFLGGIKTAGFPLPEFVELKDGAIDPKHPIAYRKIASFRPWAWGPQCLELLAPLMQTSGAVSPAPHSKGFDPAWAELYSKAWSAGFLQRLLEHAGTAWWLCSRDEVGTPVKSMADALEVIRAIRSRGHHKIVVKEALGLAGQSAIRLWEPEVLDTQKRWMNSAFEQGRILVIEPWLERLMDFSIQLEMSDGELKLRGFTRLLNDTKGQYQGNLAAPNFARRLPDALVARFKEPRDIAVRLHELYAGVMKMLEPDLRRRSFTGPLGIDAFVYRDHSGGVRLKPVVEINPRYTMGRVLVELMRQTCPGSHGEFRLINRAMLRAEGIDDFAAYARTMKVRFPLRLEGDPVARLREGVVCLNDPHRAEVCLAVFRVSRTPIV